MEKIIIVLDASQPDLESLEFACYLADLTHSRLTGMFLENHMEYEKPMFRKMYGTLYLDWEIDTISPEYITKTREMDNHIALFRETCEKKGVRYSIQKDEGISSFELISETRYADLVIINRDLSISKRETGTPSKFLQELLKEAECAVMIAPRHFETINEIAFAHNGSKSSVFAMKQFTYLFEELTEKKTIIVNVNENPGWDRDDSDRLREWLQVHYSAVGFEKLKGDTDDAFFSYLSGRKNQLVVMGAYARADLSRFFKPSLADLLISTLNQAIFICHC